MLKKRLRNDEDGELEDPDEVKNKKGGSKKKQKGINDSVYVLVFNLST